MKELHDLVFKGEIGKGNFGTVYVAEWHGALVAAKTLKGSEAYLAFQREAELLEYVVYVFINPVVI